MKALDLAGTRFGRLAVVSPRAKPKRKHSVELYLRLWRQCRCDDLQFDKTRQKLRVPSGRVGCQANNYSRAQPNAGI
jgi:hypothetical protein